MLGAAWITQDRFDLNTTNQALGNTQTSDDASGISSAPIYSLLFEARLN